MTVVCKHCGADSIRLSFAAQGLDVVNAINFLNPISMAARTLRGVAHFFGEKCNYSFGLVCGACNAYHVSCQNCSDVFLVPNLPLHNSAYRCTKCNGKVVAHTNGGLVRSVMQKALRG